MLERLAVAVTKLVNEKSNNRKYFSFSGLALISNNYSTTVYIWDEALSNIYASFEVFMSPGKVEVQQTRNYVQEAKAAELAKQQEAERKSQIKARFDNFLQQAGASKLVQLKDLMANPFRYEGTNIAVQAFYVEMLDRNTSHFQASNGGFLVVSGLDPGHSMARLTEVLLAGTVTGVYQLHGNLTVPLLTLRSIYVCQTGDCKDIIPN